MPCGSIPCGGQDIVTGTYNICIDGYDFGSTTNGLMISRNAEYVDVRNDQSCTRQTRYLKQQDWSFKTTLQSVTLDKLRLVYGLDATSLSDDGTVLTITENLNGCVIPEPFPVTICSPGPGCGCRIINFPNVVVTPETLDYEITKDNPIQLEVEFTVLADCVTGNIGTMSDDCTIEPPCSSDPIPSDIGNTPTMTT